MNAVGNLIDLVETNTANPGSVPQNQLKEAYSKCIFAMRADSGFLHSAFELRFVSFIDQHQGSLG
jgi:hypothetical protein